MFPALVPFSLFAEGPSGESIMLTTPRFSHAAITAAFAAGLLVIATFIAPWVFLPHPAAHADTAPTGGLPATVTADALPTAQVDGVVWSQVIVGNTVYA